MYRLIFEHIIRALLQEEFLPLQKRSFADREARTDLFVNKLKSGQPIDLTNGEQVVIDKVIINRDEYTQKNFEDLKKVLPTLTGKDTIKFFKGDKGYNITAFAKTTELGGKGKGGSLGPERKVLASLQDQFKAIGKPIILNIEGKTFPDIDGVTNVKENQKADFAFTSNGIPTVFVSYKPGNSPKSILIYGGVTQYKDSPELQRFIEAVKKRTSVMKRGDIEFAAPVSDEKVAIGALFGSKFKEGSYNENSIQAIVQGDDLKLIPSGTGYTLGASKIILSPNVPTDVAYAPFYNARYAPDRNQFGIQNCRFSVLPGGARGNAKVINIKSEG